MDSALVVAATPLFFLAMLIDWAACRAAGVRAYRPMAMLADLGSGCGQQALGVFFITLGTALYDTLSALAPMRIEPSALSWLALLILDDLLFYFFHRASHRINLLWAAHAVHHQSEDYNLAVALRQSWLSPLVGLPFFLPLSLLGFPTAMVIAIRTLNTLYQFGVHTRAVRRTGWLEWVLNTPSHHRVHHGRDAEYLDSNYGGIFILWDRLFGTFVPEQAEPRYGTVKPLLSWNAAWANLSEWLRLARLSRQARSLTELVQVWLGPPEWQPAALPRESEKPDPRPLRDDRRPAGWVQAYCLLNLLLTIVGVDLLLVYRSSLSPQQQWLGVAGAVVSLICIGGLADGRRWAAPSEVGRIALAIVALQWVR